jgi:hypothetical protein
MRAIERRSLRELGHTGTRTLPPGYPVRDANVQATNRRQIAGHSRRKVAKGSEAAPSQSANYAETP